MTDKASGRSADKTTKRWREASGLRGCAEVRCRYGTFIRACSRDATLCHSSHMGDSHLSHMWDSQPQPPPLSQGEMLVSLPKTQPRPAQYLLFTVSRPVHEMSAPHKMSSKHMPMLCSQNM